MDDSLDFAFAPGTIGLVMEETDAEVGADDVSVFANKRGSVINVKFMRNTPPEDGFSEGVMEGLGVLFRIIGGVG